MRFLILGLTILFSSGTVQAIMNPGQMVENAIIESNIEAQLLRVNKNICESQAQLEALRDLLEEQKSHGQLSFKEEKQLVALETIIDFQTFQCAAGGNGTERGPMSPD